MKIIKFLFSIVFILIITSCKADYLNKDTDSHNINLSSSKVYNLITSDLSLPEFKSLNEDELFDLYLIDPKILSDYVCNISKDISSGVEISVFRLKDKQNTQEVVLGIQERIKKLENDFKETKQNDYNLITNPYVKVIDNYVVFALSNNIEKINKNFDNIFK